MQKPIYKRIAVKVGSNVLTRHDGTLNLTRMSALADQIAALRHMGIQVILISSGAVAAGRSELRSRAAELHHLDSVDQRQLYSAIGQAKLINHYYSLFREQGIQVGQVLTTKESFATRQHYLNQRNCIQVMLQNGVLPIVNENDTVSVTELMFTDNDELSGLVATMMQADALIILSNVDGIYTGNPSDAGAQLITRVEQGEDLSAYITSQKSGFGRGGMHTKCAIAQKVAEEGVEVIIASGTRPDVLLQLTDPSQSIPCTRFVPATAGVSGVKTWIAHSQGFAKGRVYIDDRAVKALSTQGAVSLLPVGVCRVEGDFQKDDLISLCDMQGNSIGVGRAAYDAHEATRLIGQHDCKPLVHYDYLYLE